MKNFAEINTDNLVIRVLILDESKDVNWLVDRLSGEWVDGSQGITSNTPGIGYKYDQNRNGFIPPKPFDSWTLNEEALDWEAPIPRPDSSGNYFWNEQTQDWQSADF